MPITKIVSGGQTGADRGGLDAAIHCCIPHGGWCPKGRRALDGTVPAKYQLRETPSRSYEARTEANVADSDCTVIFTRGALQGGSLETAGYARKHCKPCLHVDLALLDRRQAVDAVAGWLQKDCPAGCVLNVAGSRESGAPGIRGVVRAWMIDVISRVNGRLFYPVAEDAPDDDGEGDDEGDGGGGAERDPAPPGREGTAEDAAAQESTIPLYHPRTVAEAVKTLLEVLPAGTKAEIRTYADPEELVTDAHFGLAMWLRNAMIHRNVNYIDLMADFQRRAVKERWDGGRAEPDHVSGIILRLAWERLRGTAD